MLFPLFDRNPHRRLPIVTVLLILANAYFFWRSIEAGPRQFAATVYAQGFIPQRLTSVDGGQPLVVAPDDANQFRQPLVLPTEAAAVYPTLLSMMFLHGSLFHLLSNMWMLWVFGDNVEDRLGRVVYLFFYLCGGVVATLAQWAINPESEQPVIGASGAVAAVLGAYAITFPWAKVKTLVFIGLPLLLDLPSWLVLGFWFVLQTVMGIMGLGAPAEVEVTVAFWAHIGGFVAGVVLMPLLTVGAPPPDEDWRTESREMFEF